MSHQLAALPHSSPESRNRKRLAASDQFYGLIFEDKQEVSISRLD
jgi:hypothetical protein